MAKNMDGDLRALNIGGKVRRLRLEKGMTLQQLSEISGISKPALSQIENEVTMPPIATLLKIAKALGIHIGDFFQDVSMTEDRLCVVRKDERKEMVGKMQLESGRVGYRYESLAYHIIDKSMEPFIVEIEPLDEKELVFYNHKGEEFIFVMQGVLEFRGGEKTISLNPGDSLYFDSEIPHTLRGLGGKRAKILSVIYTPD